MFYIFINFKTYRQASGAAAVELASYCRRVDEEFSQVKVVPVVQALDAWRVKQEAKITPWLQHLDWHKPGRATGWINLETALANGAGGTLLNHSEHSIPPGTAKQVLKRTTQIKQEFGTIVCAGTLGQVKRWSYLKADFLAYEIKQLIASGRAITEEKPQSVKKAVAIAKKAGLLLLVGAGISQPEDVTLAQEMGAAGVLVASAIVKADNPEEKLRELVGGVRGEGNKGTK